MEKDSKDEKNRIFVIILMLTSVVITASSINEKVSTAAFEKNRIKRIYKKITSEKAVKNDEKMKKIILLSM